MGSGSGHDYASLAAALAGEAARVASLGSLASQDVQLDIACYAPTDTAPFGISGLGTSNPCHLRIYTPEGERHAGVFDPTKHNLTVSGYWNYAINIQENFVRLEGLQISNSVAGQDVIPALIRLNPPGTADIRVDSCLLKGGPNPGSGYGLQAVSDRLTVRNTVVYGAFDAAVDVRHLGSLPVVALDNCTLIGGTYGVQQSSGTVTLRNCYARGSTDAYSGSMTLTTCAHSSATTFTGSTASVPHSTATFTNVTPGSEDYHLAAGSALIGAGTDLSPDFTTDIDGATRSAPWDIGADQHAGGAALAAGTVSLVHSGPAGIVMGAAPATGGTGTYTYQWQRNSSGGSYANLANGGGVSGATTLALTDGSAVAGTLYGYRLVYTDSAGPPATAISNVVTAQVYPGGALGGGSVGVLLIGVG